MAKVPQPRYVQVCESIRRSIADGSLGSGDRIQSEVDLARELGMARMTVRKGLDILVGEGVLVRRHRRGTYVAAAAPASEDGLAEFGAPAFLRPHAVSLRVETQDTQAHQLRFWRGAFDAFADFNPQYRADVAIVTATADGAGARVAGDAIATTTWALPHYVERGLLAELSRPSSPSSVPHEFRDHPGFAIPFSYGVALLVANLDMLKRAGVSRLPDRLDFSAFLKLLRKAGRALGRTCLLNCSPSFPLYAAAGADVESRPAQKKMPGRVRAVLEALVSLDAGAVALTGPRPQPFKRGEALFFACSPHAMDWDVLPADMRLAFRPLPLARGSRRRYMPVTLSVASSSAHPQAAEQLVRFLASEAQQRMLAEHRAGIPAHAGVRASLTEDDWPGIGAVRESLRTGAPIGHRARNVVEYLVNVFMPASRRILNRDVALDDGLGELASLTDLYHRGEIGWRTD